MTASERNLYDFYGSIGEIPGVKKISEEHFSMILGDSSSWPRFIYHLRNVSDLPDILDKAKPEIKRKEDLPVTVINRQSLPDDAEKILRNISAFPVELWELMEVSGLEYISVPKDDIHEIERIDCREGIEEFTGIVNHFMMGHTKVKDTLFYEMSKSDGFDFFCLRVNGEMITTVLSFSVSRVSGLYFIVTRPEFRGKGYAEALIRYVLNFLFLQGKEKVVLQAGRKAVPLYRRTGFISAGQMIVIKKI
jgi:GNAT superfamily N-acetyltransferase